MESLENLADRIYDAVIEPAAWAGVLASVVALSGASQAMFLTVSVVTGASNAIFFGNESAAAPADFQTYYAAINPLTRMVDPVAYLANWRPTIIRDEDILSRAALEHSEYYNDFLRPLGAHHGMYLRLDRRGEVVTNISLGRDSRRGRFGEESAAALTFVLPHLRRAAALRRHFDGLGSFVTAAKASLDAVTEPMLLLDRKGSVAYINASAERLLAKGTPLRMCGNQLTAIEARTAADLAGAIAAAAEPGPRRAGTLILKGADGHRVAEAIVLPVAVPAAQEVADGPAVLIRVSQIVEATRLDPAINVYGLTRAERALAVALLDGQSLQQAASERGVSISTIRCQLAGLFDKTGARRQGELVALLMRG